MSDIHYQAYLSWTSIHVLATLFTCPTYMTRHVRHTLPGILILDQHTCPGDTVHTRHCSSDMPGRHTCPGGILGDTVHLRHCSSPTCPGWHIVPAGIHVLA